MAWPDDAALLLSCAEAGLVLVAFDRATLPWHAGQLPRAGDSHGGLILFRRTVRSTNYGDQARLVTDLWFGEAGGWDWTNRIVYACRSRRGTEAITMPILVATDREVVVIDVEHGTSASARGMAGRPTCLGADALVHGRAWCGTHRDGVFRTDDGGRSWRPVGLAGRLIMAIAASPVEQDVVWVGTEPSEVWRSSNAGTTWDQTSRLETLPSSSEWSFPPRPDTHHVRWIACHPFEPERLWVAIEAGALVSTSNGGRTWHDRVPGGPRDTHELAVHRNAPHTLRVAAGDGYFESDDAGATWRSPSAGLEVHYLRSVAIDPGEPDAVVVSASSGPRTAYVAGRSDGRLYRRRDRGRHATGLGASRADVEGRWERVRNGWPESPSTIAPLLCAGATPGEMWAADERGVHRSDDGGQSWRRVTGYGSAPQHLRGLALLQ